MVPGLLQTLRGLAVDGLSIGEEAMKRNPMFFAVAAALGLAIAGLVAGIIDQRAELLGWHGGKDGAQKLQRRAVAGRGAGDDAATAIGRGRTTINLGRDGHAANPFQSLVCSR